MGKTPALCAFRVLGDVLDRRSIVREVHPSVYGSALQGLNCMVCILYHAACTSVTPHMNDRMRGITYDELEVFCKREPHCGKHALKGIV